MAAFGRVPVWNGLLAVRVVGEEQLPDAEVVLDGPVLRLGVPVVVLPDQRYCLQKQALPSGQNASLPAFLVELLVGPPMMATTDGEPTRELRETKDPSHTPFGRMSHRLHRPDDMHAS